MGTHTQKEVDPKKKTRLCYRKICWGRQTGSENRAGSCGTDHAGPCSCERRIKKFCANCVDLDSKSQKSEFALFKCPEKSRIRPGRAPKHTIFLQLFGRASGQIFEKVWVLAPLGLVTLVLFQ